MNTIQKVVVVVITYIYCLLELNIAFEYLSRLSYLVLTFCINSTRGRGGHEPPGDAGLERLGKETGEPTGTLGPTP